LKSFSTIKNIHINLNVMKKVFWAFAASMMLLACDLIEKLEEGKDPDKEQTENQDKPGEGNGNQGNENQGNGNEGNGNGNEGNVNEGDVLQPSAQKEKIAEVGQKLMDKCPAGDFNDLQAIVNGFAETYFTEEYDWSTVSEWFDNTVDTIQGAFLKGELKGNQYKSEMGMWMTVFLSEHTGHFTLGANEVTRSDYDGVKMDFSINGIPYTAEITSSGKVTEAYYLLSDTWTEHDYGYYDYETDTWVSMDDLIESIYTESIEVTVGVPEKIDIRLTENGKDKAVITLKFETSLTEEGIDITTDSFNVTAEVKTYGYEITARNVKFNAGTGEAYASQEIKKDGVTLIKSEAKGAAKLAYDENYIIVEKANSIECSLDILGEIQAKGTCSDALEAFESYDAIWDALYNIVDESEAQRHLDNFNAKIAISIYYDGGAEKQAAVEFKLASEESDYGTYWYMIPVIRFNDGSLYKIEEFFTENAFGELVESFETFCESFAEVFAFDF